MMTFKKADLSVIDLMINQAMFKLVKFEEIVIDSLHLLLRITDVFLRNYWAL
jgi:hypothetical protein